MEALSRLSMTLDRAMDWIGRGVAWLAIAMVLLQFVVVLLRYVFGLSFLAMQELVIYLHASLFMLGAAYTLQKDGHVRVDVFYRDAPPKRKALVNLAGSICLLLPVNLLIFFAAFPYVADSWSYFEGSTETSGLPFVYLLKTLILIFPVFMIAQALAISLRAVLELTGHPQPEAVNPAKDDMV